MAVLIVIAAIVLMMVVGLIAMPVTGFVLLLPFCRIIPRLKKNIRSPIMYLLRTFCYTISDFVALITGASVLRISNLMKYFPILIFLMILSGLHHGLLASRKMTVTESQRDEVFVANICGSIAGSIAAYLVVRGW